MNDGDLKCCIDEIHLQIIYNKKTNRNSVYVFFIWNVQKVMMPNIKMILYIQ